MLACTYLIKTAVTTETPCTSVVVVAPTNCSRVEQKIWLLNKRRQCSQLAYAPCAAPGQRSKKMHACSSQRFEECYPGGWRTQRGLRRHACPGDGVLHGGEQLACVRGRLLLCVNVRQQPCARKPIEHPRWVASNILASCTSSKW